MVWTYETSCKKGEILTAKRGILGCLVLNLLMLKGLAVFSKFHHNCCKVVRHSLEHGGLYFFKKKILKILKARITGLNCIDSLCVLSGLESLNFGRIGCFLKVLIVKPVLLIFHGFYVFQHPHPSFPPQKRKAKS